MTTLASFSRFDWLLMDGIEYRLMGDYSSLIEMVHPKRTLDLTPAPGEHGREAGFSFTVAIVSGALQLRRMSVETVRFEACDEPTEAEGMLANVPRSVHETVERDGLAIPLLFSGVLTIAAGFRGSPRTHPGRDEEQNYQTVRELVLDDGRVEACTEKRRPGAVPTPDLPRPRGGPGGPGLSSPPIGIGGGRDEDTD